MDCRPKRESLAGRCIFVGNRFIKYRSKNVEYLVTNDAFRVGLQGEIRDCQTSRSNYSRCAVFQTKNAVEPKSCKQIINNHVYSYSVTGLVTRVSIREIKIYSKVTL